MTKEIQEYREEARQYLSSLGLGDLRNYGRQVGVVRPTTINKKELIETILGILTGELEPISVSNQGAPVKNGRVDERILQTMSELKAKYFTNAIMIDVPVPEYDFKAEYEKMIKNAPTLRACDPSIDKLDKISDAVSWGQVEERNGKYYVLPVDGSFAELPMLIPQSLAEEKELREGDIITYYTRTTCAGETSIDSVVTVNELWTATPPARPRFEDCPVRPLREKIRLYDGEREGEVALKYMEWLLPLGKGQRGCLISPPKAGKTKLLLQIARAARERNDGLEVYALLVEQAPEAIREFQLLLPKERLFYTTYEDDADRQVFTADFLLKRLKRRVEKGKDVLLLVDSLNNLARAYNDTEESSGGKTLSCGLEIKTVRYIKKFFGAARALEGYGSLTILGAVSADTGNPVDDVLRAELSAQANYQILLDNELATRRIYPALDVNATAATSAEGLKTEREEEFDFYLRGEVLPKIRAEEFLKILSETKTYEELVKRL